MNNQDHQETIYANTYEWFSICFFIIIKIRYILIMFFQFFFDYGSSVSEQRTLKRLNSVSPNFVFLLKALFCIFKIIERPLSRQGDMSL